MYHSYREVGADPLAAYGGINNIHRADNSTYQLNL